MRNVFSFTHRPMAPKSEPVTGETSNGKTLPYKTGVSTDDKAAPKGKATAKSKAATKTKEKSATQTKDKSATSTKGKATKGKASTINKRKTSTKGKASTRGKASNRDRLTEEDSMMEEETSNSGLDVDVPARSPFPARNRSRVSRPTDIRTLSEEQDLDDFSLPDDRAYDGLGNSVFFDDDEYNPRPPTPLNKEEMMNHILQGGSMHNGRTIRSGTDPFSKMMVDELDPHPHQCLITRNLDWENEVEYCHFFDRSEYTNYKLLTNLEHSLGIGYKKFNIDDARNIGRLLINLHRRLDKKGIIALPTIDMVRRLNAHQPGDDIRKIYLEGEVFTYHFLPLLGGPTANIIRYQRTDKGEHAPAPETVTESHLYPFHTLPPLQSHVEPHYVVLNAVKKLLAIKDSEFEEQLIASIQAVYNVEFGVAHGFLIDIRNLYNKWQTPAPEEFAHRKTEEAKEIPEGKRGMEGVQNVGTNSDHIDWTLGGFLRLTKRQHSSTSSESNLVAKYKSLKSAVGSVASRSTRK